MMILGEYISMFGKPCSHRSKKFSKMRRGSIILTCIIMHFSVVKKELKEDCAHLPHLHGRVVSWVSYSCST